MLLIVLSLEFSWLNLTGLKLITPYPIHNFGLGLPVIVFNVD
jgi:hypothetical protein